VLCLQDDLSFGTPVRTRNATVILRSARVPARPGNRYLVDPVACSDAAHRPQPGDGMTELPPNTYCHVAVGHEYHGPYHDREYGFPLDDDDELFERLVLEINQAGLSWVTILKKRDGFRRAYDGFSVERVAAYGPAERARLLDDPGIIRNRLKVEAAIHNAGRILELRSGHGSFSGWLDAHHPQTKPEWVKLFRKTFRFTGGEITGEFLMSTGYLPGAHHPACPVYATIAELRPPWATTPSASFP
jgi:DNA-3-methyladenine glycosylase I